MKLLRTLILRPLLRDPLRTALTILAVALGVGVVVAIDLAGDAATGSFQSSLETLAGKTDLEKRIFVLCIAETRTAHCEI